MNQIRKSINKVNNPPGSIIYTGEETSKDFKIEIITYNDNTCEEVITSPEDLVISNDNSDLKWINIYGLNNIKFIEDVGSKLNIESSILEDIVHVGQRPKVEFYENYVFLVLKAIIFDETKMKIRQEHISFILFEDKLVTFQEFESNIFETIKKRTRENKGLISKKGIDYLLYRLLDIVVNEYYVMLGDIEKKIETIEEKLIESSAKGYLDQMYRLRKEMLVLRTTVWPLEDIINSMIREESSITENTKNYLKDVKDHLIQIIEFISIYREMILGMFDIYLSNTSNKMNQIMTTLTIFSTIFIPLTFLTGVYGMNFQHMPELYVKWSYPLFWIISLVSIYTMYRYFKNKGWI